MRRATAVLAVSVACLALAPAAGAATAKKTVSVPLPANGRQTFAVITLRLKQDAKPGPITSVKVKDPAGLPSDVRTGVATTGPKRNAKTWEYTVVVAINDLGAARSAGAAQGDLLGLIMSATEKVLTPTFAFSEDDSPCPFAAFDKAAALRSLAYWKTNNGATPDKQVIANTRADAKKNPKCR
jgi:hypothetical protein